MERDNPLGQPYDEFVAFLLMSVPYEPLFETEFEDAKTIANILGQYDWGADFSTEKKLNICRAVKDIYLKIYGSKTDIPIGMIWPRDDAPKDALDYMSRLHAVFCPYPTEKLRKKLSCETDLKDSKSPLIAFTKAVASRTPILDLITITLHEIRHFSQVDKRTPQLIQQDLDLVSHLVINRTRNACYGLMNERQANAFMGRAADLAKGTKVRSEIEVAADMLTTKQHGGLSQELSNALLAYQSFVKNQNTNNAKPTRHPA